MLRGKKLLLGGGALLTVALGASIAFASTTAGLLPSGVGNYNQFATVGSATHYLNVDESTCNGTTDYNHTTVVGERDSYTVSLASVPNGAVITSVAIKPCASRSASGGTDPVANVFYRWNGANSADSGSYTLTGTTPVELATTTYSVTLTKNASSTLEIGAILTSGTKGIRLSRIATVLTYTDSAPLDPSSLTAVTSTTTANSVKLTWTDNATNESYQTVERGTDGVNFSFVATTSANATTYTNNSLTAGTYYYRVKATNVVGDSGYSNTASATVSVPADPTSLTAVSSGFGTTSRVTLAWTDNSNNETHFYVERATTSESGFYAPLYTLGANSTTVDDYGVSSGMTYYYRVRADNAVGYSGYSNVASTTLP